MRAGPSIEPLVKWVLGIVTLLLMASMGGGFLLIPLLIPAHVWAARRSGRVGRVGWSLPPAISMAMLTWAVVYVVAGEAEPVIWIVPVAALGAALVLMIGMTTSRAAIHPGSAA